jgi:YfiH family protein
VHQVHGPKVIRVIKDVPHDRKIKADGLVSNDPRRMLSVRVADCIPVLLASEDGGVVAAVHAGWRGVVTGVVSAAMIEMGFGAERITAAVGPGIGIDMFEIGPEVVAEFIRVFGNDAPLRRRADGKGHIDLKEAIRRQLLNAGVKAEQIDVTDRCSYRDADEFFSHRRENGVTGRMAAMIGAMG